MAIFLQTRTNVISYVGVLIVAVREREGLCSVCADPLQEGRQPLVAKHKLVQVVDRVLLQGALQQEMGDTYAKQHHSLHCALIDDAKFDKTTSTNYYK